MPLGAGARTTALRWGMRVLLGWVILALVGLSPASGDVKSTDGTSRFDVNRDNNPEAVLNSTGFGLGTTTPSANLHVAGNSLITGSLVVGGTSNASGSNLHISGTLALTPQTVTTSTTLAGNTLIFANAASGNITLTLPYAGNVAGRVYRIKKTSNDNSVNIYSEGGTIDGGARLTMSSATSGYPATDLLAGSGNWHVLAYSGSNLLLPTLDLKFSQSKSLLDSASGQSLITFTRASTATYFDASGVLQTAAVNTPRFDHDPATGESLGLLMEESRTNLCWRSQELDHVYWIKHNTVSANANATTAPDGSATADKFVENATSDGKGIVRALTVAANTIYTFSVFAKSAERSQVNVQFRRSDYNHQIGGTFDLSTQTFTSQPGVNVGVLTGNTMTSVGNGWYRLSVSGNIDTTAGLVSLYLYSGGTTYYAGDNVSGIYLWGPQLELGDFPTSYISTTGATATRSRDAASLTGANFSSWYNQSEGTIFADATGQGSKVPAGTYHYLFAASDGSNNNRIILGYLGAPIGSLYVENSGAAQAGIYPGVTSNRRVNCGVYAANDFALSIAGGTPAMDSSGSLPTVSQLNIGSNYNGDAFSLYTGTIRRLTYWPARLPNATLQVLSR